MHQQPLIYHSAALAAWFWISFSGWMCLELWVWLREAGGTAGENRDRGSRLWVIGSIWVGFYGAFALMAAARSGAMHRGAMAWFAAGIALIWIGVALRWWAIHTLGRFFRTSVILQDGHRIIMHGPYRVVRNPSYSGAMLSVAGVGLAMNNWYSFAVLVGCMLVGYARRIQVEQQALVAHFGQPYRDYIAHTWALIPYLW